MYARLTKGKFSNNGKPCSIKLELCENDWFFGHVVTGLFEYEHEAMDVIIENDHLLITNLED